MWWDLLDKLIISSELYSHSGTEIATSEGALRLIEKQGEFYISRKSNKEVPYTSFSSSPDLYANYPELNKYVFGNHPNSWLVGNYKAIYVGYYKDETIRRNGASAGITTGIQKYLLDTKKVQGAITTKMKKDKPYVPEPTVATSSEQILEASQSKYTPVALNTILNTSKRYRSLVYTGLPHQIVGIRKLQKENSPLTKNINYVLGIFYGETIGFSAVKSIMRAHNKFEIKDIVNLKFREGEWPGNFYLQFKNGDEIKIRKLHANYLIPSHITNSSLYQVDFMSELADISIGDAWAPSYEQRGQGWSVVIARSQKGLDLVLEMKRKGLLKLDEISYKELVSMHSHGLDLKKRGAFIRIERREKRGLPTPIYGYRPIGIPRRRYFFETLLGVLFKIFKLPITIWLLERLPISVTGWFFVKARNFWKNKTKGTKGGGLINLKFELTQ